MRRLTLSAVAMLFATSTAHATLFDFDNIVAHTPLPTSVTVDGITANLSATGQGFAIQPANTLGFTPAGFSGNCVYPSSVFLADLIVDFSTPLTDFSILYAPEEYGCDSSATMRVTAYMNGALIGANTAVASQPGTWPSATLSFNSAQSFNQVVVHYQSAPPTGGENWGPIFMADNMLVITPGWSGGSSTNWSDIANWAGGVPGATSGMTSTDTATFNQTAVYSPLVIDVGRNLQNVVFDTAAVNSLTVGSTTGPALQLTAGASVRTTPSVISPQVVNAPLVLNGDATLTSGAGDPSATLTFGGAISPAPTSTYTTLFLDGDNTGSNTVAGPMADSGPSALAVVKNGRGQWMLTAPNAYSGGTYVNAGVLRMNIASGTPTVTTGAIAVVSAGAQLELAGSISALGTSSGNRTNLVNDSTLPGILVSGTNQVVGAIDGAGSTEISAGAALTANHINQESLVIGGDPLHRAAFTIAASDEFGNPVGVPRRLMPVALGVPEPTAIILLTVGIATIATHLLVRRRGT